MSVFDVLRTPLKPGHDHLKIVTRGPKEDLRLRWWLWWAGYRGHHTRDPRRWLHQGKNEVRCYKLVFDSRRVGWTPEDCIEVSESLLFLEASQILPMYDLYDLDLQSFAAISVDAEGRLDDLFELLVVMGYLDDSQLESFQAESKKGRYFCLTGYSKGFKFATAFTFENCRYAISLNSLLLRQPPELTVSPPTPQEKSDAMPSEQKLTFSRTDYRRMYTIACDSWKKRLKDEFAAQFSLDDVATMPVSMLTELRSLTLNALQRRLLDEIFGPAVAVPAKGAVCMVWSGRTHPAIRLSTGRVNASGFLLCYDPASTSHTSSYSGTWSNWMEITQPEVVATAREYLKCPD